jgi:hypothetical protein
VRKDLKISDQVTENEADQDETGQGHDEFATDRRAEEVADEIHRGKTGYEWKTLNDLPPLARCKGAENG